MDTAPTCVTTPIWRTRRFRAIRGASDLRAGPDRPRPHRSRPTGRLRQVGVLLAAAAPRDGHRDLSSHESRAGARHRMRLWRTLSHPVRERRHRRRRNGRPRGAPHLRAREEGGARPGGRGPRPNRPGRRGIPPVRDESFDAVVATEVLEHLDEPGRMLSEATRVLRPGGRFFMTTPNAQALPYRILRFLPHAMVSRLAASMTQKML